jgi:hypothetical protein
VGSRSRNLLFWTSAIISGSLPETGAGEAAMGHGYIRGTPRTEKSRCLTAEAGMSASRMRQWEWCSHLAFQGGGSVSELFPDRPPTFFELYSYGEVRADQIDDYVGAWHDAHETWARQVPLHEFLGLTWPEYQVWVCDADSLPAILEARTSATPLATIVAKRLEQMRAGGRATDGTTIVCLGNWLKQSAGRGSDAGSRS